MRKVSLLLCCFILLSSLVSLSSCDFPIKDSDDVWFRYHLNADETGYYVEYCNVAGRILDDKTNMVDVVIPSEYKGLPVVSISHNAFKNSEIIRSIQIPDTIAGIDAYAFLGCTTLESIHIPKNVKRVVGLSFSLCTSLKSITVDPENEYFCSIDGNLYTKDGSTLLLYAPGKTESKFQIPEGVSVVNSFAFNNCGSLKHITVSSTVSELPYDAIMHCRSLGGISVDENNTTYKSIDGNLYSQDEKTFLKLCIGEPNVNLIIPDGVMSIAENAMYFCDNIISVTIPETVKFIGENAFLHCSSLSYVAFENTSGWKAIPQSGKFSTTKVLEKSQLESPAIAADYISEYYYCEWHREN